MNAAPLHPPPVAADTSPRPVASVPLRLGGAGDLTPRERRLALAAGAGLLTLLVLGLFADVLFSDGAAVLAHVDTDLAVQFVPWRAFGFGELRHGNLALWNPHIFSGAPFFGGFQSALLYPPNWLYLVLPLGAAINWSIALHVVLAGLFTLLWAAHHRLHPLACLFSGMLAMFCGAQFLHIYAGHLPNLCAMAWGPLILLAVDGLTASDGRRSDGGLSAGAGARAAWRAWLGWVLLGAGAVALQLLAGHPQYVFYTGIAAAIYFVCRLPAAAGRTAAVLGFGAVYAVAVALAAAQLFTAMAEGPEMVRSGGVPFAFAALFALPPENLITLLVPGFFGTMGAVPYWGRCYLWEMTLFIGVAGTVMVAFGLAPGPHRPRWPLAATVGAMLVLALGVHTPLFRLLYRFVPGFDLFRGTSKFIYPASLGLGLLAGFGFDRFVRRERVSRQAVLAVLGLAAVLALAAAAIHVAGTGSRPHGWWARLLQVPGASRESYLSAAQYCDPAFQRAVAAQAACACRLAAATAALVAGCLAARRRTHLAVGALLALAAVEMTAFARSFRPTFPLREAVPAEFATPVAHRPPDVRALNLLAPNAAMMLGPADLWGYDPGVLKRYAEFMAFTQGGDPARATQYVSFRQLHPLYAMLRCAYAVVPGPNGAWIDEARVPPLPRLLLLGDYTVATGRDRILAELAAAEFDPRARVILETEPTPRPAGGAVAGNARIVREDSDTLDLEAMTAAPALLLVTDAYARGWRARPLPGSGQSAYTVLPANYVLRAIPLAAGTHRLRLEYCPSGFRLGLWCSGLALVAYLGAVAVFASAHAR